MNKRVKTIRGLLIGGLVLSVIAVFGYAVAFIIFMIVYGFAAVIAAIIGGIASGGNSSEPTEISDPGMEAGMLSMAILAFLSGIAVILFIVAIVLMAKAKNRKMVITSSILAIVGGIPTLVIPLGIIAGSLGLTMKQEKEEQPQEIEAKEDAVK